MSVAHEREEKRRAMLVWLLVLAAIPFWTTVGWLSALTMSALRLERNPVCHEVVRTYQAPPCFDHGPPSVRRYRVPGCGEPLPRFVPDHGTGALPPGDYWERPRLRRLGVSHGEYPHLLLQHRGRGERVVSPHVRW